MPVIGEFIHKQLGRVIVTVRRNSMRATGRWRNGCVSLNVPPHFSANDIYRIADEFAPKLLEYRQELRYTVPSVLSFPGVEFMLQRQNVAPDKILAKASLPTCSLEIGRDIDMNFTRTTQAVSTLLCRVAQRIAADILLPRARYQSRRVGRAPAAWKISGGFRTLGTCSAKGVISLSYILVFLPEDLRDYIICHELAHLSEMNHSPRFHALLDSYLNGRESQLAAGLRRYSWPVLRK